MARDPAGDRLGHQPLGQPADLQPQIHARRQRHAGLAEIIDQIVVHQRGRAEHRKDVDETEQLHLEGRVFHRPVHQVDRTRSGRRAALWIFAGGVQQLAADFQSHAAQCPSNCL